MGNSARILIVDDHPVVLDGLALILGDLFPGSDIITASDGLSANALVDTYLDFDWIFLDVKLPDVSGVDLLEQFEASKLTAHTVILSSDNDPGVIDSVLKKNASGFLAKSFNRSELLECIAVIESGQNYLGKELAKELAHFRQYTLSEQKRIESRLTERQHETLLLLATGYSNKEIAVSFNIAESSVKSRVKSLMELFGADNRTHCVHEAKRLSII